MATNGGGVVGFVGLGTMGARMAASVQQGGYRLVVHDLHKEAAARHLGDGAIWADTPRALASQVDVIFSSLPEPADVEAVALGPDGLLLGVRPGTVYFDLSTNSPIVVKRLEAVLPIMVLPPMPLPPPSILFSAATAPPLKSKVSLPPPPTRIWMFL